MLRLLKEELCVCFFFFKLAIMQNLNSLENNNVGPFLISRVLHVFTLDACEDLDIFY